VNKKTNLTQASIKKIDNFLNSVENEIEDYQFFNEFPSIILKDVKMIKDCAESSIVDFYIETCKQLLNKYDYEIYNDFYKDLKEKTRSKLVDKYVSKATFDNNIDIYFNEVKREYIMHPMGESEDMAFVPENRDVFIKNNLKLVIDCAKRYQNLGLPLEDLIQAGNEGLLITFNKFDTDRANLRFAILDDINKSEKVYFTHAEAEELIKRNFKYTKTLEATLKQLPANGFNSKKEFIEWTNINIKKASFSSIAFAWIRATIISEINKLGKIIRVPKLTKTTEKNTLNIIRLDSVNPHTDDCYHDNQISETANDDFAIIDESIENMEKQNLFKGILDKIISKLSAIDRRIIKKKFGIDVPFQMSINEIAENEGISPNKVKYSITNTLKTIEKNISPEDKKYIIELLK
jgi:RNA polymerase primary sigma factor